eukprot:TRINITY_DN74063_c0_g1_i1.p1 TRINITY_DN74063_c0_g1~~TRINITY_DN74063_c0_g1_i1.p1  ORF type:complete len:464 (-),score=44.84 TRINITY_DN74063_c0_g1_i1:201-1592(-)
MCAYVSEEDGGEGAGDTDLADSEDAEHEGNMNKRARLSSDSGSCIVLRGGHPCPPKLVERWRAESLCDVQVVTHGGGIHRAHRIVLAAGSNYMGARLDACETNTTVPVIELLDISWNTLNSVLEFIYAGECSLPGAESLLQVVEAAGRLQVKQLLIVGANELETHVLPETCLSIWNFADSLGLRNLQAAAKREASLSFDRLTQTPAFEALSWDKVLDLLKEDHLTVTKEESVFDALNRWLDAQSTPPQQYQILLLLKQIRFPLMAQAFISQRVRTDPRMNTPEALNVLLDAFQCDLYRRSSRPRSCVRLAPSCKAVIGDKNPGQSRKAVGFVLQALDREVVLTGISTYFQRQSSYCQLVVFHQAGIHGSAGLLNLDLAADAAWTSMAVEMSYAADSLGRWPIELRVSIAAGQAHTFIAKVVPAFMDRSDISIVSHCSSSLLFEGLQFTRIGTGTVAGIIHYTH